MRILDAQLNQYRANGKTAKENSAKAQELKEKISKFNELNSKLNYEITLRRSMESTLKLYVEELKSRNKELEHFQYLASNEFQEPLRTVISFAKVLSHRYQEKLDNVARELLNFVVKGARCMQQIVLNLSDYTMLHPGNQKKEFVSMQEALRHVKNRLVKKDTAHRCICCT